MTARLVTTTFQHTGHIIDAFGKRWVVSAIEYVKGEPGCEDDAVAYLSPYEPPDPPPEGTPTLRVVDSTRHHGT